MTAEPMRAPLAGLVEHLGRVETLTGGSVVAREVTGVSQVALRVAPSAAQALPFAVPIEPNTWTGEEPEALWLGPDEWLLVTRRDAADVIEAIGGALGTATHAAVDVGANRAIVEVSGSARHDLLASRCALDLHPRALTAGSCAQTVLGRAPALVQHRGDATRVLVRPSFGRYVVDLLVDAAALVDAG